MTFTRRYRPETWWGIVDQPTEDIQAVLDGQHTPNVLLYGPPGTGKSSTARLVARELDPQSYLWLDASDDRGIGTVQGVIKDKSRQMSFGGSVPVIVLDEVDGMTHDAQNALRGPMERNPGVFVLTANDVEKLHDAVRSRCHKKGIEFDPIDEEAMVDRLDHVAEREGVDVSQDQLAEIASMAEGDMRAGLSRLEQLGAEQQPMYAYG